MLHSYRKPLDERRRAHARRTNNKCKRRHKAVAKDTPGSTHKLGPQTFIKLWTLAASSNRRRSEGSSLDLHVRPRLYLFRLPREGASAGLCFVGTYTSLSSAFVPVSTAANCHMLPLKARAGVPLAGRSQSSFSVNQNNNSMVKVFFAFPRTYLTANRRP
jgi:hypothetical protein